MKRSRNILLVLGLLLCGAGLSFVSLRTSKPLHSPSKIEKARQALIRPAARHEGEAEPPSAKEAAKILARAEASSKAFEAAFTQPMAFFGRVIEQNGEPIPQADVIFLANDHPFKGGTQYRTQSGSDGRFALTGIHGASLNVHVFKNGYYDVAGESHFMFVHDEPITRVQERPMPTAANPALFYLRKKGEPAPLIKKSTRSVMLRSDGAPAEISFSTGKQVPLGEGELRVEYWRIGKGQRYDWSCRISVPGGGLVERLGQFEFQAPDVGYQPAIQIDRPADLGEQWSSGARQEYFAKTKDGNYARFQLRIIGGDQPYFVVDSYLNVSGSQNLEFDEKLQPFALQP